MSEEDNIRILLLEDTAEDIELIERALRRANLGFSSRREQTAKGLDDAINEFKPDVILSDYAMPGFSALEALRLVRERGLGTVPFILVTGSQSDEVAVACMREGADDYILKSNLNRLPTAVSNALRQKRIEREKSEAVAALRQKEATLREAQRIGHVGSWERDLASDQLTWSEETYRIFGRSPGEFVV